jgi:hypothetical protein
MQATKNIFSHKTCSVNIKCPDVNQVIFQKKIDILKRRLANGCIYTFEPKSISKQQDLHLLGLPVATHGYCASLY